MRIVINQARRDPRRVVFPEGEHEKVLRAARVILDEGLAKPVLLGREEIIGRGIAQHELHLDGITVVDPERSEKRESYLQALFALRQRKGVTLAEARELLRNPTVFGAMMIREGDGDALVAGVSQHYPDTLRPALQILHTRSDASRVAGLHMIFVRSKVYFFADTTVNIEPTAEELAEIALGAAEVAARFHVEPRVAMVSFSNFGSVRHPLAQKVRRATEIVKRRRPDLIVDGEMQADTALLPDLVGEVFPFSSLRGGANVLVFPELQSANAAYKLMQHLGGAEAIGPILTGMSHPVHVLQHGCEVKDIVNMAAIAVVDAQEATGPLRTTYARDPGAKGSGQR